MHCAIATISKNKGLIEFKGDLLLASCSLAEPQWCYGNPNLSSPPDQMPMWPDLRRPSWPGKGKIFKGVGSTPSLWLQKESQIELIIKWTSIIWPPEVHPHWLNSRFAAPSRKSATFKHLCYKLFLGSRLMLNKSLNAVKYGGRWTTKKRGYVYPILTPRHPAHFLGLLSAQRPAFQFISLIFKSCDDLLLQFYYVIAERQ